LEGLAMVDVGIFYGQLVNLTAIWYLPWQLVHFTVIWYIFPVLVCCSEKNLATLVHTSVCVPVIDGTQRTASDFPSSTSIIHLDACFPNAG
jgi:hypothetical protein